MAEPLQNENAASALEIVRQLEASGALGTGGRLPALLRYLVSEELAGRGDRLKAYAIATEVLGRSSTFDPSQDSIVRVEVARLRRALDYYYASAGRNEPLKITIPRGGYRPVIGKEVTPPLPENETEDLPVIPFSAFVARWVTALATVALISIAGVALWLGAGFATREPEVISRPAYSIATPRLVLLPIEASDDASRSAAPGLRAQIAALLAQQSWLAVSVEENFIPLGKLPPKLFTLSMVLSKEGDSYVMLALMHSKPENRLLWSGRYASTTLHQSTLDLVGSIATDIGRDLGYPLGPVGQAVAAKSGETAPEVEDRFLCMMNSYRYWRGLEPKQREDSLACLERLTARWPDFTEGRAMLVLFALEDARTRDAAMRAPSLARAESLLRGAPIMDRLSLTARMMLNACKGDVEATRQDAHLLFTLAPNDPDSLAEVANAAGMGALDWTLALNAEARAFELASVPHARYAHARAAKLLLDGQYEAALAAISRVPQNNLADGQMMLLALATLADAPLRAQSAEDSLAIGFSRKLESLQARIDSACWHSSVKAAYHKAILEAVEARGIR
jgi:adenylate cyclase